jgi:NAD(P)-dependent dehydrogenase (short-subunit alcohol dehydrogenase family)
VIVNKVQPVHMSSAGRRVAPDERRAVRNAALTPEREHAMSNQSYSLQGKRAVVLGAATGIGRAIALEFLEAGARVLAADIDGEGLAGTVDRAHAAGAQLPVLQVDVADRAATQAAMDTAAGRLGGLDTLVYSVAWVEPTGSVLEIDGADWDRVMAVNLTGAFNAARAVLPHIIAAGGGSITLLGSQLAQVAQPGRAAYCASKGGIVHFARALAVDHAAQGVRVNSLSPGAIATSRLERRFGSVDAAESALGGRHLLGRLGRAEEIATAARFLASDAARFMTGSDLLVDGGYVST